MTIQVGYCTNVHAGTSLAETRANLKRYALAVKERVAPREPMGVGLWLPASAARQLLREDGLHEWRDWLGAVGLMPFTFNGFPYGDFHQKVVKHRVYEPTWFDPQRLAYTRDLITILDALLPAGMEGSISTLPLVWGRPAPVSEQLEQAAAALRVLADELAALEKERGRRIAICLEPEPGCVLERSRDVVRFFEKYLLRGGNEAAIRRHICVCHDICHAVVMFEEQADVLRCYRAAGIGIGKIQVSSGVMLAGAALTASERAAALRQLGGFAEDRYLHQTVVSRASAAPVFYEDLPLALAAEQSASDGEWRVHFHVPVYLDRFGLLAASHSAILDCLREAARHQPTRHFEVETYAWSVLPAELQQPDLAAGIAEEMSWFRRAWTQIASEAIHSL
jgi:hypothetical protein